jgi:hypothetical protein
MYIQSKLSVQARAKTPAPININWYNSRTSSQNVKPTSLENRLEFNEKLDEGSTEGFVEGSLDLPLDGQWLLQLYVGGPAYDRNAPPNQAWPTQNTGIPNPADSIKLSFNGREQTWTNVAKLQGTKTVITEVITGSKLAYRFDYKSGNTVRRLHPFVSNGQITLIRDSGSPPASKSLPGTVFGKCINAVDGKIIMPGAVVSNGGPTPSITTMKIPDSSPEIVLSLFVGSSLFTTVPVTNGQFSISVPAGKYGVLATMPHFYAFYDDEFEVVSGQQNELLAGLSPVLNPGMMRVVLTWGQSPQDLDSYMSMTSTDIPSCVVYYKKKACDRQVFTHQEFFAQDI